jgi:tripartite-type tricarboxylate transporter receptor subunit TctC
MRIALRSICAGLLALAALSAFAQADDYPRRPIRMILPNAPGSSNDTLARVLAARMGDVVGQQIVIENQAGASGLIGMETARNAAPDGYTIVSASPSGMTIAPNLRKRLPYDPLKDFEFVSMYAVLPNLLVVTPSLPVKSVRELIDYCKSKPGQVNMASAGPGSQSHLAGAMMQVLGHFESTHVPYKGRNGRSRPPLRRSATCAAASCAPSPTASHSARPCSRASRPSRRRFPDSATAPGTASSRRRARRGRCSTSCAPRCSGRSRLPR